MTTFAPTPLHLPGAPPAQPPRRLWLITFVDLVMLLLAFFVLMFSMSSLDSARFAAVARSYTDVFHGAGGGREAAVGPVRVPLVARTPGDDLAYLEAVLRTTFAGQPRLSVIQFRLTSQYLILLVPAQMTAAAGLGTLDDETQGRFFELGGVLSNLSNRIAIVAPVPLGAGAPAWPAAALRARSARAALQSAGYERDMATLVQGSPEEIASDGELPPVQIIVFPETVASSTGGAP
ncbi:MAG: hypothetical protein EPO08_10810 [Rhodospirillaceae bacterium]|nr:MAG: hypothetical protein EPO08_10810 [Rhodospirillaceae bacterium]